MEDQISPDEREADMMLAFRIFDADNKGYIESAELRYIILNMDNKIPRDELNEMIASVKLDQDKRVSYQGTELSVLKKKKKKKKRLNAEVHTTQELNLLVILPDLSCERPRVRRHLNVKIQN